MMEKNQKIGFGARIRMLRQQMGLTQISLSQSVGVAKSTLSLYESEKREPDFLTIEKLARALRTTPGFLIGGALKSDAAPLSQQDLRHLQRYHALSFAGRQTVDAIVENLIEFEFQSAARPERVLRLPVYNAPAAAGAAMPVFDDSFVLEEIENPPSGAQFGIRLQGDSMEPAFPNSSVVWVRRQEKLEDGEVGVFLLNGESLCKILRHEQGNCLLCSFNPDYDPIPVQTEDDLRIVGKVLHTKIFPFVTK